MYARTHAKAATDPKPSHLALGRNLAGKDSLLAPQHEIQPLPERDRGSAESSTPAAGKRPVVGFSFGNLAIGPTERLGIQAKLTIGHPHDRYEQEADRVADQVMRMRNPTQMATSTSGPPSIQRLCPKCEEDLQRQPHSVMEEDEKKKKRLQTKPLISSVPLNLQRQVAPTSEEDESKKKRLQRKPSSGTNLEASPDLQERINGLHGGGQPLSTPERTFLEPRFGYDFSRVRLHTDERAAEMARSVNARAFTLGQDVVFGAGHYQPRSTEGQRLLAHELTHVVQQSGYASQPTLQRVPFGEALKFDSLAVCPPRARVLGSIPDPDIAKALYGDPNFLIVHVPGEEYVIEIEYNRLKPEWKVYFTVVEPCTVVEPSPSLQIINQGTVSEVSWGETSGLYPHSKHLYQPDKWDQTKTLQLLQARAAINEVGKRGEKVKRATPARGTIEQKMKPYHLIENFPAIDSEIADPTVKWFYLSKYPDSPKAHPSVGNSEIIKTYGPFYNIGGGDVPKGSTYVHFYKRTP